MTDHTTEHTTGTATRILLVRHGETEWNKIGRWQGYAPIPLNPEGDQQARRAAAYLAGNGFKVDALYSSDLLRCRQTVNYIAEALGKVPVRFDVRLREIHLGMWQGLTREEIMAWDGENWAAAHADPIYFRRPGGESADDVGRRASAFIEETAAAHPGQFVLAVTHGGVVRNTLRHMRLHPEPVPIVDNTALTLLRLQDRAWALEYVNQTPHLGLHPHDTQIGEAGAV